MGKCNNHFWPCSAPQVEVVSVATLAAQNSLMVCVPAAIQTSETGEGGGGGGGGGGG